jgi:DNA-binding Lrp family transcriptional regulator
VTDLFDDTDSEILRLLMEDPRQSYRSIAKSLNISHVNVSNRVKEMEKQGKIKGYTTIFDPDILGYYPLCLRISALSGYDLSGIGRAVSNYESASVVLRVSGECELLALIMCPNRESAITLLNDLGRIEGIGKIESHIVLETIKLSGKMLKK